MDKFFLFMQFIQMILFSDLGYKYVKSMARGIELSADIDVWVSI